MFLKNALVFSEMSWGAYYILKWAEIFWSELVDQ